MRLTDGTNTIDCCAVELHSKLAELELKHRIAKGLVLEPTADFLRSIVKHAGGLGLKISLSGAWQLWRGVCLYVDRLRKREAISADIAHWFGVNPFELSEPQRAALYANLHRVQAQAILNAGNYSPTDFQGMYDLTLLATGSEHQALAARALAMKRYVESKVAKDKQNG